MKEGFLSMGSNPESLRFYTPHNVGKEKGLKLPDSVQRLRRLLPERLRRRGDRVDSQEFFIDGNDARVIQNSDEAVIGGGATPVRVSNMPDSAGGFGNVDSKNRSQYPVKKERKEFNWEMREIRRSDIPQISDWFKDGAVRGHIGNDRIDPYIPTDFDDPVQVSNFQKALEAFYFPPERFSVELKTPPHNTEDGPIPTDDPRNPKHITVSQFSHVCTINDRLVGVQSWYTDDPYAPIAVREEIDKGAEKAAHGLVMIVDPAFRRLSVAKYMTATRSDIVLGINEEDNKNKGAFTQISGLVTYANGWNDIFDLFSQIGYEPDRDPDGHAVPQIINGKEMNFWRVVLGRKKWWRQREKIYADIESRINPRPKENDK